MAESESCCPQMAGSWFEKGRPALFEALSSVCDQIGRDLHSEFLQAQLVERDKTTTSKSKERTQQDGEPDIIARLEAENEELRKQLAILKRTNKESNTAESLLTKSICPQHLSEVSHASFNVPPPSSTLEATSTVDEGSGCNGNCSKILKRYHAISANFKTAKEALQRKKEERKKWVRYTAYLNQRILDAEEQYGIQILDGKTQKMEAPPSTAMEADEQILDTTLSFATDDGPRNNEPQLPRLAAGPWPIDRGTSAPQANSDTTQGEASDTLSQHLPALPLPYDHKSVVVKQEPSSDIPQIVAERQVKKRRHSDEIGTAARPRVKLEATDSSSPLSIPSANVHTQESLDLGDIMQRMQTPRKRPLLEGAYPQTEVISRSTFANVTPVRDLVRQQPQSAINPRALMPLSVNVQVTRSKNKRPYFKDRPKGMGRGIADLVEDGAAYGDSSSASGKTDFKSANSRLGALLDRPPSALDDENIIFRPVRDAESRTPTRGATLNIPGRRQLPFEKSGARCNKLSPGQQLLASNLDGEHGSRTVQHISPQRSNQRVLGSLREKSISQLCLEDFKVNPAANDGHDFVFSEVVREKSDRACLSGCIDMHCCGKHFRALAISQRPNSPLTPAQRQEEQKMLEEYLGDHSYRLAAMDREERLELWIEAKTQELANKYGKHRHRFSRMQSPPGFWDADFPSTQQLEADREEAAKRTRRTVAERYREAVRPGGRWIFRDE